MSTAKPATTAARLWLWDALSALAFFAVALICTRIFARIFTPFGGLFFFAVTAGLGWRYARLAWRGIIGDRQRGA